jgi:hypothetical protein
VPYQSKYASLQTIHIRSVIKSFFSSVSFQLWVCSNLFQSSFDFFVALDHGFNSGGMRWPTSVWQTFDCGQAFFLQPIMDYFPTVCWSDEERI